MELATAIDDDAFDVRGPFDPFFRTHFARVARAAALIAGDAGTGQDVAQEAFIRLFQRWEDMASDEHARNFAYKVAFNLARSHLRKHLRLVPSGLRHADDVAQTSEPPGEWGHVTGALGDLPRRQRACVVLVDYADMDAESAGRVLGINASTVRVHLMHARRALRERLQGEDR
jgi:RNA polymerase sigma factor (sigma-70 family)